MTNKSKTADLSEAGQDFLVVTVSELDEMVKDLLVKQGAARKPKKGEQTYVITDKAKAHSGLVMPQILNPLGKKGWNLAAVNKMECYIFLKGDAVEYRVETPPDIDRRSIHLLQKRGHLQFSGFEGQIPAMEVTNPEQAKIQIVLPQVLATYKEEGWSLCAINGPQLYFFSRPLGAAKT